MSRVVPSGQTHPSLLALCSKVFSQTHTAEPSTTLHTPALLQLLFAHGSGRTGAGVGAEVGAKVGDGVEIVGALVLEIVGDLVLCPSTQSTRDT